MANPPFQTKTVSEKHSVADDHLKPDAELHMLVGGPYTLDGKLQRYGHTAIRIKTTTSDTTYDFGRYGLTTGEFGAKGEGILRVWSDFGKYIASENILGRETTDFMYPIFDHQAKTVNDFYGNLLKSAKRRPDLDKGRAWVKTYQLPQDYDALGHNCTTLSLDATRTIFPTFENGSKPFIKPGDVLTGVEEFGMTTIGGGTPNHLFLPANLQKFLSTSPAVRPTKVTTHDRKTP